MKTEKKSGRSAAPVAGGQNPQVTKTSIESVIRRKAIRKGYRLTKIREASCWFDQYGPYMLADASTNGALVHSLTLEEADDWLANSDAASWLACASK